MHIKKIMSVIAFFASLNSLCWGADGGKNIGIGIKSAHVLPEDSSNSVNFLAMAVAIHNVSEVRRLLGLQNKDKRFTAKDKSEALLYAADMGSVEMLDILLRSGTHVDMASSNRGITALMVAAQAGHANVVDYLVRNGANIFIKSGEQETAYNLAKKAGHTDIVKLLSHLNQECKAENSLLGGNYWPKESRAEITGIA